MPVLVRLVTIVAASVLFSVVYTQARGVPWKADLAKIQREKADEENKRKAQKERERIQQIASITLEQLKAYVEQGAIIVDARDRRLFAEAHLKAPIIINVPSEEMDFELDKLHPGIVNGRPIVLYCNSDTCEASDVVYLALERLYGYRDMYIYYPGWEGIVAAALETVGGEESWGDLQFGDAAGSADPAAAPAGAEGQP